MSEVSDSFSADVAEASARIRADLGSRLEFLDFSESDRESLRRLKPFIEQILPGVLDQFYADVLDTPATAAFFNLLT